jgi:HEAT repeat protein
MISQQKSRYLKMDRISQSQESENNIQMWIADLGSPAGSERLKARSSLIREGVNAVPLLIQALSSHNQHARWEAAEALVMIKDPSAAPALVRALEDEDHDVRWAAMKALIALNRGGLEPLLQALIKNFDSVWLREGAHHILNVLKKQRQLRQPSLNVLRALESIEPEAAVVRAAEAARESLFGLGKERQP